MKGLVAASLVLIACTSPGQIAAPPQQPDARAPEDVTPLGAPPDWDRDVRLPEAPNTSTAAHTVAVNITAAPAQIEFSPGVKTQLYAYNGMVPGPIIHAHVGDRVIVTFTNNLPEDSTIHWHGIRLPVAMDGVPGHTQAPVPTGGTFTYDFVVPDAGLFWYHPHVASAKQVGDGLYGALLVDDPAEPAGLGDEVVMVLSDISLDAKGQLLSPDSGGGAGSLFGREGTTVLVNGKVNPVLLARPGLRQRWRLVNAARSRYFQIQAAGQTFTRIGSDGGFLEAPIDSDRILLIPGQRADVLVTPTGAAGSELAVRWIPYDRGYGSVFMRPPVTIATLRFTDAGPVANAPVPAHLRTIARTDTTGATVEELRLTSDVVNGKLVMGIGINGQPSGQGDETIFAKIGETQVWNITNEIEFAHPFHLHGFFFQVLSSTDRNGVVTPGVLEWRDTADVPTMGKMSLVVKYDDRPGMWMFHCHILDHADAGMMGMLMLGM